VMIVAIDQDDFGSSLAQRFRRSQAAEAAATITTRGRCSAMTRTGQQLQETHEQLIAFLGQRREGTPRDFLGHALLELLAQHLVGEIRSAQVSHQAVIGPVNCSRKCANPPGPPPR